MMHQYDKTGEKKTIINSVGESTLKLQIDKLQATHKLK